MKLTREDYCEYLIRKNSGEYAQKMDQHGNTKIGWWQGYHYLGADVQSAVANLKIN